MDICREVDIQFSKIILLSGLIIELASLPMKTVKTEVGDFLKETLGKKFPVKEFSPAPLERAPKVFSCSEIL